MNANICFLMLPIVSVFLPCNINPFIGWMDTTVPQDSYNASRNFGEVSYDLADELRNALCGGEFFNVRCLIWPKCGLDGGVERARKSPGANKAACKKGSTMAAQRNPQGKMLVFIILLSL